MDHGGRWPISGGMVMGESAENAMGSHKAVGKGMGKGMGMEMGMDAYGILAQETSTTVMPKITNDESSCSCTLVSVGCSCYWSRVLVKVVVQTTDYRLKFGLWTMVCSMPYAV